MGGEDILKYLVTGEEMKLLDQNTSEEFYVPTVVLMEQAAMAFVQTLLANVNDIGRVLVVCGTGNNGADGIAIARLLNQRGMDTDIYLVEDSNGIDSGRGSELYQLQKRIYMKYGYGRIETLCVSANYDVVIEAIFGIGLSRTIEGVYQQILNTLNECKGRKVAVDMPAGISTDSGAVLGTAFRADDTITFSFAKLGQYLWPGTEYCGRVHVADMGITLDSMFGREPHTKVLELSDLAKLSERKAHSNKGTYGKLLIIAGSVGMAGAAILASKAAYRSGVGLVRIFTREENRMVLQGANPEAILTSYQGDLVCDHQALDECVKWADAIVVGPGLGCDEVAESIVAYISRIKNIPIVMDADALNLIAKNPEHYLLAGGNKILTPHLGEMARLNHCSVSDIQNDLMGASTEMVQRYGVTCVLKDFHTIIACWDGDLYLNLSGNNGMATAGSGDVLAGVIGGLLAQGLTLKQAATAGVFIHGLAGDCIATKTGLHAMMANDLIDGLQMIWKQVEGYE